MEQNKVNTCTPDFRPTPCRPQHLCYSRAILYVRNAGHKNYSFVQWFSFCDNSEFCISYNLKKENNLKIEIHILFF